MNSIYPFISKNKSQILICILLLFYSVGSVGIHLDSHRSFFLSLSPYNLVLSFIVTLLAIETIRFNHLSFFITCYFISMFAEWLGTSKGYLFGSYCYGNNLGSSISGVPWVIGLNWWILAMGASSIVSYFRMKPLLSVICGALLMTILDAIMEPIAIRSDFWHWKNGEIPFYNFICWFIIAFILLSIQQKVSKPEPNKVHAYLFGIIALFFVIQFL